MVTDKLMFQIQSIFAWVCCIPIFYFVLCRHFLNNQQLELLIIAFIMLMLISFHTPWIYPIGLLLMGRHVLVVYNASRSTFYFSRLSAGKANRLLQACFEVDDRQILMVFYTLSVYIWIRMSVIKSWEYDIGGGNFIDVLNGWNCTMGQFWVINSIWLVFILGAWFACNYLINNDFGQNNLYRFYLRRYLVYPDLIVILVAIYYNFQAYQGSDALSDCKNWYFNGIALRTVWFWGFPLSTLLFFSMKQGIFQMKSSSQRAQQCQNELDQQLNRQQIEQQHSRASRL